MKIEDIGAIIKDFLSKEDSYTSVLVDGSWGCGKTTQIRKSIEAIKNKKIIYVSLFGIKSTDELTLCYNKIGRKTRIAGNVASIGFSAIPIVGSGISTALSNVLDQFSDTKKAKKRKIFVFDDLERVDENMSLISLLGLFNTLLLNGCKVLCLSALNEIQDKEKRKNFDRFVEKAFDRIYHIDEKPEEIYARIFSKTGVTNLKSITEGFNGNIRLAKRTAFLFHCADKKIGELKDKHHDFYKKHSKDELLFSAMLAIKILYSDDGSRIFTDEEKKSYPYMFLEENSEYFGKKVSNAYISEFLGKKNEDWEHDKGLLQSLTRDLIFVEMFNNYDFLEAESRIVVTELCSEEASIFSGSFYYLNDKDKKRYVQLLNDGVKSGAIKVDSTLMTMVGEVCSYSNLVILDETIDIIVDNLVSQVNNGDNSAFDKASEQRHWVVSKNPSSTNYAENIYRKAKLRIDENRIKKMETNLVNAYNSKDFKFLLDTYYELSEGSLYSKRNEYIDITIKNDFFLPNLEESITHTMWSYCHQMARYCKATEIGDKLIEHLRELVKKYPDEESLRDKAYTMVFYNIDPNFKIEDLKD